MSGHKFPIKTIAWHEDKLLELDDKDHTDLEVQTVAMWHVVAIGFLEYGEMKGFDGPAAEVVVQGSGAAARRFAKRVEPYLNLGYDDEGHPRFEPIFTED